MTEWSMAGKVQGTWNRSSRERTVQGANGPWRERSAGLIRSRERTVPGTKVSGNERSREQMFQGTYGPENESSIMGTNVLGNE